MGKLETIMRGFDEVWEDLIYDRCTELPTLFEIDNVDAKWLKYLKPILGFTSDLSFSATTEELRRLLPSAMKFWNDKPSEEAIADAIRMVTGNRYRIANFFDFRMQTDVTVIGEELEDFDPWVIDFPGFKLSGTAGVVLDDKTFSIGDLPAAVFQGAVFYNKDNAAFLVITKDPTSAENEGIYPVAITNEGTATLGIVDTFPVGMSGNDVEWQLLGFNDDFVTEVRIVDPGYGTLEYDEQTANFTPGDTVRGDPSGAQAVIDSDDDSGAQGTLTVHSIRGRFQNDDDLTDDTTGVAVAKGELQGVLNRTLLSFLINLARSNGERVDIVYLNFLDQFLQKNDLDQWTVTGTVTVPEPGGAAVFAEGGRIIDADTLSQYWGDQIVAWKIVPDTATTVVELAFYVTDSDNHYYVEVDYSANSVKLYKKVSGTPTQIGSTVTIPVLKPGVADVIRVDAVAEGANTRIRVKVNGETEIDEAATPAAFTAGSVGAYAATSTFSLELVEVNVLPTEIDRVGPQP